ncbi:Holliday junction resolvase, partial [Sorangium cellulosum]
MRVLGIDPGSRHLGWGLLVRHGTRVEHIAHGVIDIDTSGTFAGRLVEIDDELGKVIAAHAPDAAAVESLFFAKDAQSAAKLGHARGVVLLRLARAGVPISEYPPALVKRTIVGRGAAE